MKKIYLPSFFWVSKNVVFFFFLDRDDVTCQQYNDNGKEEDEYFNDISFIGDTESSDLLAN